MDSVPNKSTKTHKKTSNEIYDKSYSNIKIKKQLPKGVFIPKTPKLINLWLYSSIILLLSGLIYIPLIYVAFISIIITLTIMITNKEYKSALKTQQAINAYRKGNMDSCKKCAKEALKYKADNNSAKILLRNVK